MKDTGKNQFARSTLEKFFDKLGLRLRGQLVMMLILEKILPFGLIITIAVTQISSLGNVLRSIAVEDSSVALNQSATENIERMTTDTAFAVASFLYERDDDILYLASMEPTLENYSRFIRAQKAAVQVTGEWQLSEDGQSWVPAKQGENDDTGGQSTNGENNDMDGFRYRRGDGFSYKQIPLYDEITFVDLDGVERVKVVAEDSPKTNFPLNSQMKDISKRENTYVKAETYFEALQTLATGEIYVSDVIGAYVGSNYIGMYAPSVVQAAAQKRGYDIPYEPENQAYAGAENPNGQRFEGIIRWATPVEDELGTVIGYVTFALNHDHIMEFVDHITPMAERYTDLPSAYDGNYAFIWDYQCRSICHPRHHSIVGFDPETGEKQIPWLEESIYQAWQKSQNPSWVDFTKDLPQFYNQSRSKSPAGELTKQGLVGLDGRYLNNAPQCTGWMDLTKTGGSGSFYILWSGLYKLTTAAAIPYYTGQYAPTAENGYSKRGFGIVTIGAGLEDFTAPATQTEEKLETAIDENLSGTTAKLVEASILVLVVMVVMVLLVSGVITDNITRLIKGISRFRKGERQFRFKDPLNDEFAMLADSFDEMADSIVASNHNPLFITDMNHIIIYASEQAVALSGHTLEEMVGTHYGQNSIYPQGSSSDPILALNNGVEPEVYCAQPEQEYYKGKAAYLFSRSGEKVGYIIESQNVTDMVLSQLALERAVEAANTANAHKGDFLAKMSHEIRTPMNAIIGLTGIVEKKLTEPQDQKPLIKAHMHQIGESSRHLLGLINDILDISTIEAGKIQLVEDEMDLRSLIETVAVIIKPRCDEKSILFTVESPDLESSVFRGDALRLRQVLINLLGNAVKFTPKGGRVTLKITCLSQDEGQAAFSFEVIDTGIGIAKDRLDNIFKPFEQADRYTAVRFGGTGLGLSISSGIVELFGGELRVQSHVDQGSVFDFVITLQKAQYKKPESQRQSYEGLFEGKRILVVDDVEINRMVVTAMLEGTGIVTEEAADGAEAVNKVVNGSENYYDLILMDVSMPNMDGYEATSTIRACGRQDLKTIPIIALTANAFKQDRERAQKAGMDDHIPKPVDMQILLKCLDGYLCRKKA